jgi:Leucine-rich repeat (LRR) protein
LSITAKVYDRAHRRLESLLVGDDDAKLNMMHYSELLWSQLIQLQASLPTRILDLSEAENLMTSLELPPAIVDSHKILSDFVFNREVLPRHVTLPNDWNLVAATVTTIKTKRTKALTVSPLSVDHLRQLCTQVMTPLSRRTFQKVVCLENHPLQLCRIYGEPLEMRPTIPHSILLTGSTTLELNLCMTNLRRLPHHFGLYFPRLKKLRLFGNRLQELPETMHYLKDLEVLDVGNNHLAHLPSQFALPCLIVLKAGENRLTELPATVKGCKKLEYLDLLGNPVGQEFWSLVAELPRLREVQPNKRPCSRGI